MIIMSRIVSVELIDAKEWTFLGVHCVESTRQGVIILGLRDYIWEILITSVIITFSVEQ